MENKLHELIWKRYVRMPYGHVLDYADKNGDTPIPTAEECNSCIPNIMSWGVSIENGAFFTGLYLYGLCENYDKTPNPKTKEEILLLAKGLFLLSDVSKTDGFIARGVADDGVSHYPFSSEDQFGPWLLGLSRLSLCDAADEYIRREIQQRIIRAIKGILNSNWNIPTEWDGITRGSYAHSDWRGSAKLLYTAVLAKKYRVISNAEFEKLLSEHPDNGIFTRPEIVSNGFVPDMLRQTGLIQFWIDVCAQLCVKELIKLDPDRKEYYIRGLSSNGAAVVPFLRDYEKYILSEKKAISYDWHLLNSETNPWNSADEAVDEAGRQCGMFFGEISPGMGMEKQLLGQAVFGGWIAAVSGNKKIAKYAYDCLCDADKKVNWEECGYNIVFALEAAIHCCNDKSC